LSRRTFAFLLVLILSCGALISAAVCFLATASSPLAAADDDETGYFTAPQYRTYTLTVPGATYKCKMGIGSQYFFIGPSPYRNPRFYSAIMAKTEGKGTYIYWERIEVSGKDPNGNILPPDHFTNPTIVTNPDTATANEIKLFKVIFDVLASVDPTGLSDCLKCGVDAQGSGGISYGYDDANNIFWVQYYYGAFQPLYQEKALRVGFQLDVYPGLEGTYTIYIHYKALCYLSHGGPILELSEVLQYRYINKPNTPPPPSGPTIAYTGVSYNYTACTTDPNLDTLRYLFDWGDGTTTQTDWVQSGVPVTASHAWTQWKTFKVRVRAQDCTGAWSDWSQPLEVLDP